MNVPGEQIFSNKVALYRFISVCALIFMGCFMFVFTSSQSFWTDELDWTIGFVSGKALVDGEPIQGMLQALVDYSYNLPLYYIILMPLYFLMPYGETFLLIPSILFVVVGIVALGKTGRLIGGPDIGFLVFCVAVTSSTLMIQGAWEVRPYALVFCLSALTLLYYLKRFKMKIDTKNNIIYGMLLVFFLYSHWFSVILVSFYGCSDLYLRFKKKNSLNCILPYIGAGAFFVPWLVLVIMKHRVDLSGYAGQVPGFIAPLRTVYYLLSNTVIYLIVFCIGFCIIICQRRIARKEKCFSYAGGWISLVMCIVWVVVPVLIYCKFIRPGDSFYSGRHFFVIIPHVLLIAAYGIYRISVFFNKWRNNMRIMACVFPIMVFLVAGYLNYSKSFRSVTALWEPYREVADYLMRDSEIYSDGSLIMTRSGTTWIEYYFHKRGWRIPQNVAVDSTLFIANGDYIDPIQLSVDRISHYERLYLFEDHNRFSADFLAAVGNNFVLSENVFRGKRMERSGILQRIENVFWSRQPTRRPPAFGLRVYSKR
jgi:hypothetical protein